VMPESLVRIGMLILLSLLLYLMIRSGWRFTEVRRQRVLAAEPLHTVLASDRASRAASSSCVRILAFSSADCPQCHRLQAPALQHVLEARGPAIAVVEVDAPTSPELTHHYQVLTVPTTVVLDAKGRALAVNYGFITTQHLLEQVDEVLALCAKVGIDER
jgi:thioredoxin-related protein